MKPEYYIYTWQVGAFRSNELSKSLKGYSSRSTAERIAKFRFEGTQDRIRYCVALTDEEAFAEMTRQNMPNTYYDTDDVERCYKCGRLFHARPGAFGSQFCSTCLSNHYVSDGIAYQTDRCGISEWINPSEKKRSLFFGKYFINYYNTDGNVYHVDNFSMKHPYTTKEFIEYMLAQFPYGWGYIMLHEHGEKLVDDAVKCEHVNGHLKTSLPEKYMNREVYMAEAWVTFPRMDISISLQTKGFESWNMTGNKEGGTLK